MISLHPAHYALRKEIFYLLSDVIDGAFGFLSSSDNCSLKSTVQRATLKPNISIHK